MIERASATAAPPSARPTPAAASSNDGEAPRPARQQIGQGNAPSLTADATVLLDGGWAFRL